MTARPKLQITCTGNLVEFYVDGRLIADDMDSVETIAKAVARALGADVEDADEPDAQPYTYFIAYIATMPGVTSHGNVWWTCGQAIEGKADLDAVKVEIQRAHPDLGEIVITNFICTDGPS